MQRQRGPLRSRGHQLLAWLNTQVQCHIDAITSIESLSTGTAYLILLTTIDPSIGGQQIFMNPSNRNQAESNFVLLAKILAGMKLEFALNITQLTQGSYSQNLRLLSFLYSIVVSIEEGQQVTPFEKASPNIAIVQPQKIIPPISSKSQHYQITDNELSELQNLRKKLKSIETVISVQEQDTKKIQLIQCISSSCRKEKRTNENSSIVQHDSHDFKPRCNRYDQVFQQFEIRLPGQLLLSQQCVERQKKRIELNKQFKNQMNNLRLRIGALIVQFLNKTKAAKRLSKQQEIIISKFQMVYVRKDSVAYLFLGKDLEFRERYSVGGASTRKKFKQIQQKGQSFMEARKSIRLACETYMKSVLFLQDIFRSKIKLSFNKIISLKYLSKISEMPNTGESIFSKAFFDLVENDLTKQKGQGQTEIPEIPYKMTRSTGEKLWQPTWNKKIDEGYLLKKETSTSRIQTSKGVQQRQFIPKKSILLKKQVSEDYWSIHRRILMAQQVLYFDNKKYGGSKNLQLYNDLIYRQGFFFEEVGSNPQILPVYIQQSQKYTNLVYLFNGQIEHNQNELRLQEFVKIMLEMKHESAVQIFMDIYDSIVKYIRNIGYEHIQSEVYLNEINDVILEKLEEKGRRLNNLFVIEKGKKENLENTTRFLKIIIYCFLAEKIHLRFNPYYDTAFQIINQRKDSTIKAFEKKKTPRPNMEDFD